ncbi:MULTISPECIES: hypothetical protein [unclassified Ectothiorhodospira]|uniref:hypothetical protein n=1 Tax=unclassified Ectothiorhodospira TaxID=2684909 RepID=UPI001EE99926|nr:MULTISPECIES: hypothetical protein [unclassified Ectothiorhodospira]MCG5517083.1 hypothetical protein [Ectothiorhodospira sp. 9100]MCG5520330.1 hypothetical protein [Ectothiorhodospira sp. 9905]
MALPLPLARNGHWRKDEYGPVILIVGQPGEDRPANNGPIHFSEENMEIRLGGVGCRPGAVDGREMVRGCT